MSNINIPKIEQFTEKENYILKNIICNDKIIIKTDEEMKIYKKLIQLVIKNNDK